jgi:hypothetical protein
LWAAGKVLERRSRPTLSAALARSASGELVLTRDDGHVSSVDDEDDDVFLIHEIRFLPAAFGRTMGSQSH